MYKILHSQYINQAKFAHETDRVRKVLHVTLILELKLFLNLAQKGNKKY